MTTRASGATGLSGLIRAHFSVSSSGQPDYRIPITVPPGAHGVEPRLSLQYAGSESDGLLGVGWRLSGLSAIRRVGQTPAQDGRWSAVNHTSSDRFALDNQRLIVINGSDGADGAEYRTEIESWSKIVSHGDAGGGPEWFSALTRSGNTLRFGSDASSRIFLPGGETVRVWALTDMTDLNGNSLHITYEIDVEEGSYRPARIDYTANPNVTPPLAAGRSVLFGYETRSEPVIRHEAGARIRQSHRLASIVTQVRGATTMEYRLTYSDNAVTGRSQLAAVTLGDAGGNTLPPVSFDWLADSANVFAPMVAAPPASGIPTDQQFISLSADLTGNGRSDLIRIWADETDNTLAYAVYLATDRGFANPIVKSTNCPYYGASNGLTAADIDGDGSTELVYFYLDGDTIRYCTLTWNVTEFAVSSPMDSGFGDLNGYLPMAVPIDIDGDGRTDLIAPYPVYDESLSHPALNYFILRSNGTAFETQPNTPTKLPMPPSYKLIPGRVTPSAPQDLVYAAWADGQMLIQTLVSNGESFDTPEPVYIAMESDAYSRLIPVDATGDGLTDVAFVWSDGENYQLRLLNSDGLRIRLPVDEPPPVALPGDIGALMPGSLASGARTDLLYASIADSNTVIIPYVSRGNSFVAQKSINTELDVPIWSFMTADARGCGRSDFVVNASDPQSNDAVLWFFSATNAGTGRIATIHTGIGGSIDITYAPLTDASVYSEDESSRTKGAAGEQPPSTVAAMARVGAVSGFSAPIGPGSNSPVIGGRAISQAYTGPTYVVAAHQQIDGLGATYNRKKRYGGGRISTTGRGWLGFARVESIDIESNSIAAEEFAQTFPLTGRTTKSTVGWLGDASPLRTAERSYIATYADNPRVADVQCSLSATVIQAGASGPSGSSVAETTYDNFGNATEIVISSRRGSVDGPTLRRIRTYYNDPASWTLGLLSSSVDAAGQDGSEQLRRWEYSYNPATRQLTEKRRVNFEDAAKSLITTYAYDAIGNTIGTVSNDGSSTTATYPAESDYAFPSTRSRAAGGGTTLLDAYEYDLASGHWIRHVDPNQIVRTRTLDSIGRVASVNGPGPDGAPVVLETISRVDASTGYQRITQRRTSWLAETWQKRTRTFDGLGRRILDTIAAPADSPAAPTPRNVARKLDSSGRIVARSLAWQGDDPILWIKTAHDPLGRIVERVHPLDGGRTLVTKRMYDGMDAVVVRGQGSDEAAMTVERYAFVAGKRVPIELIDPIGRSAAFAYNALGRMVAATPPGDGAQQIDYDSLGARNSLSGPSFGTIKFANDPIARTVTTQFANGRSFTRSRDPLRRITMDAYDDGSRDELTYDAPEANSKGRLRSARRIDSNGTVLHTRTQGYDPFGRLASLEVDIAGARYAQTRSFSPRGRTEVIIHPDGSSTKFRWNGLGDLLQLKYLAGATASPLLVASYSGHLANGRPSRIDHGNATVTKIDFDGIGRMISRSLFGPSGAPLARQTWRYTDLGQVAGYAETVAGASAAYLYDAAGQLSSTSPGSSSAGAAAPITSAYDYDPAGNITAKDGLELRYDGAEITVTGQPGEEPGSWVIRHDAAGNRVAVVGSASRAATYRYDACHRLIRAERNGVATQFQYGHDGRRLTKTSPSGTHVYPNRHYAEERMGSASPVRTKLLRDPFGVVGIIRSTDGSADIVEHLEQDLLGSTILVTDANGVVQSRLGYTPFGAMIAPAAGDLLLPTYCGSEFDAETGLSYFSARYYDPEIGRFITADSTLGGSVRRPGSFNRYAYVFNDPINKKDPSGHGLFDWLASMIIDVGEIIVGIIAGIFEITPLAQALIGAGIGGAAYDITALAGGQSFSWAQYGLAEGMGALGGLTGGESFEPEAEGLVEAGFDEGGAPGAAPQNAGEIEAPPEDVREGGAEDVAEGQLAHAPAPNEQNWEEFNAQMPNFEGPDDDAPNFDDDDSDDDYLWGRPARVRAAPDPWVVDENGFGWAVA